MSGHAGAILDIAIVDKGRNVVSVSKDGTARLWDCGQSQCITELANVGTGVYINCCAIRSIEEGLDLGISKSMSEREVGTEGKLLIMGCENKRLIGVSLQSKEKILDFETTAPINCCSFITQDVAVIGSQDGVIQLLDLRSPMRPLVVWEESASPVLSLLPFEVNGEQGFFVGRNDGTCLFHSFNDNNSVQLTGSDCDPVYSMATNGQSIFTACRDSNIRKYNI
jgi:proteasomal ATPase-associated factor 1